jgi:ATP-dependent Lon protease
MPYNLRNKKIEDSNPPSPPPSEEDIESDESYEDKKEEAKEILESMFGAQEDNDTISNNPYLYYSDYFEENDNNFIDSTCGDNDGEPYKKRIKTLREIQTTGYVKIFDIMDADIPDDKKADLVVMFDRMKQLPYYCEEFIDINEKIKNTISLYRDHFGTFAVDDNKDLLTRIKAAEISEENRGKLFNKFFSLQKCDTNERHEILAYIDAGIRIVNKPYVSPDSLKYSDETASDFAKSIRDALDTHVYGQVVAKEEIIDNVISRQKNADIGNITVFRGSPGVGKTHTARKLAELLGYKFYHISISGISNPERINGSLSVHIGSRPGEIFTAIAEMGCNNGIIFLDEFDKIFTSSDDKAESLRNAFLNILDPTQNSHFRDNYLFDLNIDLSKIWFIISVNDMNCIGGAIRDRLRPVIAFQNYTKTDKIEILKLYTVPKTLKMFTINPDIVEITEEAYHALIGSEGSDGVRETKSICESVFKRISVLLVTCSQIYRPSYFVEIRKKDEKYIIDENVVKSLMEKEEAQKFLSFYN